jgi:hypothetical protein
LKPRKKHPKILPGSSAQIRLKRKNGWMVCGFDTSMSSLAGAAIAYDRTLKKFKGPGFVMRRWTTDDHYFDRLKMAALSHELVWDLLSELTVNMNMHEIYIAQEEPIPLGLMGGRGKKGQSGWLKQQAEISGAFLGGLLRYGYSDNLAQINSISWRKMIADSLGITTHPSKWRSEQLAKEYNCALADSGKFRSKEWAMQWHAANDTLFRKEIPDWPEIIGGSKGKRPRPEESKARALQPDDRYDALAICWAHTLELVQSGILTFGEEG